MVHINIVENGKSLLSVDVKKVDISQHRKITKIFKVGEKKVHAIVPSRIIQTVIMFETDNEPTGAEFYSDDRIVSKVHRGE